MRALLPRLLLVLTVLLAACEVDIAPVGLRLTPAGTGPRVRYDAARDVPLPSDIAAAADPTSRTGRRPGLSAGGTTALARELRAELDAMEGWGVSQPITVGFERSTTTDVRLPAIDVEAVRSRMADDEHDPANDPFYVVNLSTGIPALLDVGAGYSPLTVRDPARYATTDRKGSESNLLFETVEEGAELPFFAYSPARDRDFDGVLDHPNRYDWYERETDTLILRPIVPLEEATEYAVVLTDRLRGPDGQIVRSPFEAIHHPTQRSGVARLQDWLTDNRLARYYGDLAGTGLDHVAFAWTFTTAPAREDLRVVREGLRARGPLARLGRDFPVNVTVDASNGCAIPSAYVDRIVTGSFDTPDLLPERDPAGRFDVDYQKGEGTIRRESVPWVLVVPKPTPGRQPPFPVVVWIHDDDGFGGDAEVYGADYARQGIAFLSFNRPGFGAPGNRCLGGERGGFPELNRPWWTGHLAHDRDRLRQAAIDAMNLVRIIGAKKLPELGGPIYVAGAGAGGIVASMVGATEPEVAATAPIASGGSLADAALRSARTDLDPVLGPFVHAAPRQERADSICTGDQRSVRMGTAELACLDAAQLTANVTVIVTNVTKKVARCAVTEQGGRFAIGIPTDAGDRLDVQIYDAPDVVGSYATCHVKRGAPVGRRIQTFEQDRVAGHAVGDRLVALTAGLGLRRQSPELRRFRDLAQALLDPADPAAFAGRFMLDPVGDARPLFIASTVGDADLPVAAQLAFARAAGALPFLPPSAVERLPAYANHATPRDFYDRLGARTPMRFLVESGSAEGVARVGRTSGGPACKTNVTCGAGVSRDTDACATALFDPDWTSEGALPFDQPHPDVPLRLARIASLRITDSTTLAASWEPRLSGVPFAPDATGWTATAPVVALWNQYVEPGGAHAWRADSECRVWDPATYGNGLIARFLATNGHDVYYLSHPSSHGCLAKGTCDIFQ